MKVTGCTWTEGEWGDMCTLYICVCAHMCLCACGWGLAMPLEIDCPHLHILMAEMVC